EEARKVLASCLESIPDRTYNISQSLRLYYLAESLYNAGEQEKANATVERTKDYLIDELIYYIATAKTKPNYENQNLRFGVTILNEMATLTKDQEQAELSTAIEKSLEQLNNSFMSLGR